MMMSIDQLIELHSTHKREHFTVYRGQLVVITMRYSTRAHTKSSMRVNSPHKLPSTMLSTHLNILAMKSTSQPNISRLSRQLTMLKPL
ncbi:hypothetical protein B2G88_18215 [Natronolimnobius baerhuensis]|uniref:Uncharacterized protein n=1 Tax=Natronolimnobius baerhuensis TaxID=253108 RepID=A0A202E409_9EURY|nr:hypothetical protein B2G88_18215 [Natronolimnobius baerhuensis]